MTNIISDYDKNWLAYKTLQQEYITNEYLRNEADENFRYIAQKFFPDSSKTLSYQRAKLLNPGSGLFQNIGGAYSFYTGSPIGDLDVDLKMSTEDRFVNAYMVLGIVATDGVYSIERIPSNLHFYDYSLEADVILRLYEKGSNEIGNTKTRYLLQTIYTENSITNKLYKLGIDSDYNKGTEVPLDTINDTKNLLPYEVTTLKPLRVFKEDPLEQHPISEADKIKPIVYSIDRKTVMFECEFLKNVESYKIFSGIDKPKKDSFIDMSQNENGKAFFGDEGADLKFVSNVNSLIQDAINYEANQIRRLSSITKIPTDFMGLDNAHGAIGEGSRSILHGAFIKKIQYIRDLYDSQLREMYKLVAIKNGVNPMYSRPDIYTKDSKELLDELILAKDSNIMSHTRAIMEYMDVDKEQAEMEMKEILEQKEAFNPVIETNANQTPIGSTNNSNTDNQDAIQG